MLVSAGMLVAGLWEILIFREFGPMRGVFVQIAGAAVLCAVGTVLARNLIHSALYLVAFFFLVACLFIMLEAEFLAVMQVLVFIGAVAILLMFGIMLTQDVQGDQVEAHSVLRRLPAAIVAIGLFVMLAVAVQQRPDFSKARTERAAPSVAARERVLNQMPQELGLDLMQRWCLPFELVGLILTASLVGAVALAQPVGSLSAGSDGTPSPGSLTETPEHLSREVAGGTHSSSRPDLVSP